ncbi:MAG: right-handed parallel beta-helix repeat-containing protein [Planctomycetota bacterium]|jgi:hypothetical protein
MFESHSHHPANPVLGLIVSGLAGLLAAEAHCGTVIFVNDDNCPGPGNGTELDPFCSIQEAIGSAAEGDLVLVAPGTYYEEAISFLGRAITLRSSDGPEATTIDGTGQVSDSALVICDSGEGPDTVLDGFTITGGWGGGGMHNVNSSPTVSNCRFVANYSWPDGGGMYNLDSSPIVTDCIFDGNVSFGVYGGGMHNENSSPIVTNCIFTHNQADWGGGGLSSVNSTLVLVDCNFSDNFGGGVVGGGVLSVGSSLTVDNCTFSGNNGSGLATGGGTIALSNSLFDGNTRGTSIGGLSVAVITKCVYSGNGRGLWLTTGSSATVSACSFDGHSSSTGIYNESANLTVRDCTLTNCAGGIVNNEGGNGPVAISPLVVNCVFVGNTTSYYGDGSSDGAAMVNWGSSPTLINCTFAGNVAAGLGGAIANYTLEVPDDGDFGPVFIPSYPLLANCILVRNSPAQIFDDTSYPSWSSASTVNHSSVEGGWSGDGFGNHDADPMFFRNPDPGPDGVWGTNDEDFGDLHLQQGSPCIDAGDNTAVPEGIATDLDGNPRFVDDPEREDCWQAPGECGDPPVVDMGAYEFQALLPCPWDLNGDGVVDHHDLLALINSFGPCDGCPEDLNGDGIVNGKDVAELARHFGPCSELQIKLLEHGPDRAATHLSRRR